MGIDAFFEFRSNAYFAFSISSAGELWSLGKGSNYWRIEWLYEGFKFLLSGISFV